METDGWYILQERAGGKMGEERRRFIRPEALNLLDYLVVDDQGRQGEYSMARTLNVSKGGILMETHRQLPKGQQVMITLGLKDQLIDVMGKIVYVVGAAGRFHNGIEFFHLSDTDKRVLDQYVSAFHARYTNPDGPVTH
jgi:Tfp pilus assembly protein PilZ